MTPANFAARMREIVRVAREEPAVKKAMADELIRQALIDEGYGEGVNVLEGAENARSPIGERERADA